MEINKCKSIKYLSHDIRDTIEDNDGVIRHIAYIHARYKYNYKHL